MKLKMKCLQLDLARQKETLAYIRSFFDFAKDCGYDTVMIYFETSIRTSKTDRMPAERTYSADEVRQILSCAREIGLEVIPSLQNLSYLTDLLSDPSAERFAERPGRYTARSNTGCLGDEAFVAFADEYITEVVSLFDGPLVNMGFDEQFDLGIDERCRDVIAACGGKSRLFLRYVRHTHDLLARLGKRMMMWDDWLEYADILGDLPHDIILIHWNYVWFSSLPNGHWTGRVLRDPFGAYERLGFDYIFAFYAQRTSSAHNLESLTRYAEKYEPLGALTTTWDSSDCFYEGAFPVIRLAPALWDGRIGSVRDAAEVCARELGGDVELAELLLLSDVTDTAVNERPAAVNFAPSFAERLRESHLTLLVKEVTKHLSGKTGRAKTVVEQILCCLREQAAKERVNRLSDRIFDCYEGAPVAKEELLARLREIRAEFEDLKRRAEAFWPTVRPGIVSRGGALEAKFARLLAIADRTERDLASDTPRAVLTIRHADIELYHTAQARIVVQYENGEREAVYEGSIKPPEALLEIGGSFAVRFALPHRPIAAVTIEAYGEGALYPENVSFRLDRETVFANTVLCADAEAEHPENAVKPDCSFAKLGCEDGAAHFEDASLAHKRTSITLGFRTAAI